MHFSALTNETYSFFDLGFELLSHGNCLNKPDSLFKLTSKLWILTKNSSPIFCLKESDHHDPHQTSSSRSPSDTSRGRQYSATAEVHSRDHRRSEWLLKYPAVSHGSAHNATKYWIYWNTVASEKYMCSPKVWRIWSTYCWIFTQKKHSLCTERLSDVGCTQMQALRGPACCVPTRPLLATLGKEKMGIRRRMNAAWWQNTTWWWSSRWNWVV